MILYSIRNLLSHGAEIKIINYYAYCVFSVIVL